MALFLRDEDVNRYVSMEDMLEGIETMQRRFGQGAAYNLSRRKVIGEAGSLSVMGDGLFYDKVLGVKTYTLVSGKSSFQVSLYDADTGELLCYTQANRLGQLRTGATIGVAMKYLSNSDSTTLGIIGTGYQASTQLEAIYQVRDIQEIRAFSRTPETRESFAKTMSDSLGIKVIPVDSGEQSVTGRDIVVCIAATLEPVLRGEWLSAGVTVIGAGPTTWRAREVNDEVLIRADKIFVDSLEQAPVESGDMASAVDRGILQWSRLQELRHAVAKNRAGRVDPRQVIFAKLMGTGVADVAAAKLAYDRASVQGLGMAMDW